MPQQNKDKCYAQQPRSLSISVPDNLRADWQLHFYQLLATHLKLDDDAKNHEFDDHEQEKRVVGTEQALFFNELNRHVGPNSTYTSKSRLLESLKALYCLFTHPKSTPEQQSLIASRIKEDITQCSPGFENRLTAILILFNTPKNLDELIAEVRFHLVYKIAGMLFAKNAQSIHVHNRLTCIANQAGFGVWPINPDDVYLRAGSDHFSDGQLLEKLKEGFDTRFRLFGMINLLGEQIEALLATHGYAGNYADKSTKEYLYKDYDIFSELINQFIEIDNQQLFSMATDDETDTSRVIGINWQKVKLMLLEKLNAEDHVDLAADEAYLLVNLPTIIDHQALMTLISNDYELAACLNLFSEWTIQQKAALVMAYIQEKSQNDQKNILAILKNEIPQLTNQLISQPGLQQIYFKIAIEDNDIAAVRRHIEQGADINVAFPLLFSEHHKSDTLYWLYENKTLLANITAASMTTIVNAGKHQGKNVAEILVSTKKGRQLLWENANLRALLPETLTQNWQDLAKIERNNLTTIEGFFKKPNPLAIQLVQYIAYGDMDKSKKLLDEHPSLAEKLLTETVTVIDYSRRKIKKKTAFQVALCAWDDEMCEMLAKYMSKDEMAAQYKIIFPESHEQQHQKQTSFNFDGIVHAINQSNNNDVDKALSLELPNTTALWVALEQFRLEFTKHSQEETVFNPQHLIAAFEIYNKNYDNWSGEKCDLFWRQVIGYVQRYLPSNIAMDFAQGLYYRVEEAEKSRRSFNFRSGGGSFFPLTFDSFSGLGFEYACLGGGGSTLDGCGTHVGGRWRRGRRDLQNLCRAKTSCLRNLCEQQLHQQTLGV